MARTGFYPGSFDPVTYGHLDIIARAARLVDKLVLGVGVHHGKQALIDADTRIRLLEQVTKPIAEHTGLIIRGLRDSSDFDYEVQMGQMNGAMAPDIETVFLAASPATRMIASSLVKQIAKMGGDITLFIPKEAQDVMGAALKRT
jgi:pantetheine-phosphate adenylyltransferase